MWNDYCGTIKIGVNNFVAISILHITVGVLYILKNTYVSFQLKYY